MAEENPGRCGAGLSGAQYAAVCGFRADRRNARRDRSDLSAIHPFAADLQPDPGLGGHRVSGGADPDVAGRAGLLFDDLPAGYASGPVSYTHLDVYKRQIMEQLIERFLPI